MTEPEPWPDLLQAYLTLAAGRGAAFPAQALRRRLGTQIDALQAASAAETGPPLSIVTCPACYGGHTAETDYDPATRRSSIFCAEAGRVGVADEDLATLRPNLRWLPDQLTQLLSIRHSPPRRTLVEDAAWWLGDSSVGRTQVSFALSIEIRVAAEIQQLVETLRRLPPPGLGLLLVSGDPVPAFVNDLSRYQPIPLEDVVRVAGTAISMEGPRLAAWVRAILDGKKLPTTGRRGRPSLSDHVLELFHERRQRRDPYSSKLHEAKAIRQEWKERFPDQNAPSVSAIRGHLPPPKDTS